MNVIERANELVGQIAGFATMSLTEILGTAFMRVVMFFVDLMLGL
jgi:hypothetical protein